jgi:hypothetical protein
MHRPHPQPAVTVAERTREAVDRRPFLYDALTAGVVNYTAAAELLALDAGTDAVTAALRRYAAELSSSTVAADARVRVERGLSVVTDERTAPVDPDEDGEPQPLLRVGDTALVADDGDLAVLLASGTVSPAALEAVLGRLRTAEIAVEAAGVGGDALLVAVPRRESAPALRVVEDALADPAVASNTRRA